MLKFKVAFDKVRYQPKFFLVILFLKKRQFFPSCPFRTPRCFGTPLERRK